MLRRIDDEPTHTTLRHLAPSCCLISRTADQLSGMPKIRHNRHARHRKPVLLKAFFHAATVTVPRSAAASPPPALPITRRRGATSSLSLSVPPAAPPAGVRTARPLPLVTAAAPVIAAGVPPTLPGALATAVGVVPVPAAVSAAVLAPSGVGAPAAAAVLPAGRAAIAVRRRQGAVRAARTLGLASRRRRQLLLLLAAGWQCSRSGSSNWIGSVVPCDSIKLSADCCSSTARCCLHVICWTAR